MNTLFLFRSRPYLNSSDLITLKVSKQANNFNGNDQRADLKIG
jgi:hypothetical protein